MDSHQIERLEKHRKLPDEGKFLAGADTYDEHGHPLPTGTVPLADPRQRPAEGDIVDDVDEQQHAGPTAPAPAEPYGGSASESHVPRRLPSDTDAAEQTIPVDPAR
jgi:hypothetical protein